MGGPSSDAFYMRYVISLSLPESVRQFRTSLQCLRYNCGRCNYAGSRPLLSCKTETACDLLHVQHVDPQHCRDQIKLERDYSVRYLATRYTPPACSQKYPGYIVTLYFACVPYLKSCVETRLSLHYNIEHSSSPTSYLGRSIFLQRPRTMSMSTSTARSSTSLDEEKDLLRKYEEDEESLELDLSVRRRKASFQLGRKSSLAVLLALLLSICFNLYSEYRHHRQVCVTNTQLKPYVVAAPSYSEFCDP